MNRNGQKTFQIYICENLFFNLSQVYQRVRDVDWQRPAPPLSSDWLFLVAITAFLQRGIIAQGEDQIFHRLSVLSQTVRIYRQF